VQVLENFVYWLASYATGSDVDAMCALESVAGSEFKNQNGDDFVLSQKNGDLLTVIDIRGARKYVGVNDHDAMTENFTQALSKMFRSGSGAQHSFSIGFRSDPLHADSVLARILSPQVKTAKNFGITNVRMLTERRKRLASVCVDESVYLIIRTHAKDLQPHERKSQGEERTNINAKIRAAAGGLKVDTRFSQAVPSPLGALLPKHQAAVKSLVDDLQRDLAAHGAQLLVRVLGVHDAIIAIRRHLDSALLPLTWRPRLLGDAAARAVSSGNPRGGDASGALPTRISRQMLTSSIREDFGSSREVAEHNGMWYGSAVLEIVPEAGSAPFDDLANRIGRSIPWRASFEVLPNGQNYRQLDKMLASLLGAIGDYNKAIRKAYDHLKELSDSGEYIGTLRVVFTTWSESKPHLLQNLSNLTSSIEGWGAASCTNETGEPGRALLASAAGFSIMSPAPFLPAPMRDVSRMLPFSRPASIWDRGQIVFTTNEGRPYPVEFGSSMQNYWSTIGFAPTGSGKSFTLNVLNSGLLLAPGAKEVPPITLVDVGKSGALVMNWFRSILPEHLKDQVLSVTIRNSEDYVVNGFDTQHGFDQPLPSDVDFLVAMLATMSPGCGPESEKFFEKVVRVGYDKFGRTSPDSKRWQNAYDAKVAQKLDEMGFVVTDTTRVWQVVDALFDAGHINESQSAQRYAMPVLSDMTKVASDSRVYNVYGNAMNNGEKIIEIFTRNITASLDSYSILSGYTRFNLGVARAVAIDLQDVVGSMTSEEGRRRSGLMFLLARRIGARNYFLKWDEIEKLCPPRYARYQQTRVSKLWETIKFLQYDEAHYFSGIKSVTELVQADLRTGRKFNLVSAMFSQLLDDFSDSLIENTYIFFIMGLGDASPGKVKNIFGLSEDEMTAISRYCVRPGAMFARFKTKEGTLSQILRLNASAYEQWAFTTQGKDQTLRNAMAARLPFDRALDLLTDKFPSGTAESYLNRLLIERSDFNDDDDALADYAADRLIRESEK
jgi:intracellular multiplication protein IcmB